MLCATTLHTEKRKDIVSGNKEVILREIRQHRLIAVIRGRTSQEAQASALALARGGIRLLEITLTVPNANHVLETLAEMALPRVTLGAGSVTTAAEVKSVIASGARFVVSPILRPELLSICQEADVVCVLGGMTPTEVMAARDAGADCVKVFPADAVGGATYLKSLLAPLPGLQLIPTGGIGLDNFVDFLKAGASAVGFGSALLPRHMVEAGQWEELAAHAHHFVEALQGYDAGGEGG